jgi:hypothetical protein
MKMKITLWYFENVQIYYQDPNSKNQDKHPNMFSFHYFVPGGFYSMALKSQYTASWPNEHLMFEISFGLNLSMIFWLREDKAIILKIRSTCILVC